MAFAQIARNWERLGRLYAGLLIAAYGAYEIALWPGALSNDSIETWWEAEALVLSRSHSVLYNLTARLLTRAWHTPAAVIVVQIAVMAFALAWALREIVSLGGSRRLAWVSAVALAVVPAHAVIAVSMWPDAFFSAAVLVFTVMIIRLLASNTTPQLRFSSIVPLAFLGALVALLRPNGPPVPVMTLALMIVFAAPLRRFGALALAATISVFLIIDGPVYEFMGVQPASGGSGLFNPFILQVAAHTQAGTPTDDADVEFLHKVYPTLPWPYDCQTGMTTGFAEGFKGDVFRANPRAALKTWWHLTRQAPKVNIRHQRCLNAFIWKVTQTPMYLFSFSFQDGVLWTQQIDHAPQFEAAPVTRGWKTLWPPIEAVVRFSTTERIWPLAWAPGTYLYMLLSITAVAAIRNRRPRLLLAAAPVLANTAAIALFTGTMEYRYLESTALVAIVLLPLIALQTRVNIASVDAEPGDRLASLKV